MPKDKHIRQKKKTPNGITFGMVSVILIGMSIVLILASIKTYLSNQIYYESKILNKKTREVEMLRAEKVLLEQGLELLRFKSQITDTIFTIREDD